MSDSLRTLLGLSLHLTIHAAYLHEISKGMCLATCGSHRPESVCPEGMPWMPLKAGSETGLLLQYEDELLKATALSVLPQNIWELIGSQGAQLDELARRLLAFFKNEFFTWVGCAGPPYTVI